jgi:glycosyltransferase involved in cell wall biosynthesis
VSRPDSATRVVYSFPHRIGAGRICETAWQQVAGVAAAGADVLVFPGAVARELPTGVRVQPTLARGSVRVPYRLLGHQRALHLHDRIVARRLPGLVDEIDLVHTWPSGALETLKVARRLGIPTVLERPNAHTRVAYEIVQRESQRLEIPLPPGSEHAFDAAVLAREEEEFRLADRLLCPSDFVRRTFLDEGYPAEKLARHSYGYDEAVFYPGHPSSPDTRPFTALFVGHAAVRKGLHFALDAWLRSPAHRDGIFLIAGSFLPAYETKLAPLMADPSVQVLGHRTDVPELMRRSDILVLPSLEEGSPLAALEALGSGCVPLVSDVCSGACRHMENALVHPAGDVEMLADHIGRVHADAALLATLRAAAIESAASLTWTAAGRELLHAYREAVNSPGPGAGRAGTAASVLC